MTQEPAIDFTREKLEQLKLCYEKHKDDDVFTFEGCEMIPSYAKYLIEYLEGRLVSEY